MELYPKAKVFNSFNLKVSELHSIFVEESGNQNGKPVILSVSLELYDEPTVEPFTRIHIETKQILPILVYRIVLLYKGTVLDPALSVTPIVPVLK